MAAEQNGPTLPGPTHMWKIGHMHTHPHGAMAAEQNGPILAYPYFLRHTLTVAFWADIVVTVLRE
jgi:hypothetical protein